LSVNKAETTPGQHLCSGLWTGKLSEWLRIRLSDLDEWYARLDPSARACSRPAELGVAVALLRGAGIRVCRTFAVPASFRHARASDFCDGPRTVGV